jgi:hypothetical protein
LSLSALPLLSACHETFPYHKVIWQGEKEKKTTAGCDLTLSKANRATSDSRSALSVFFWNYRNAGRIRKIAMRQLRNSRLALKSYWPSFDSCVAGSKYLGQGLTFAFMGVILTSHLCIYQCARVLLVLLKHLHRVGDFFSQRSSHLLMFVGQELTCA